MDPVRHRQYNRSCGRQSDDDAPLTYLSTWPSPNGGGRTVTDASYRRGPRCNKALWGLRVHGQVGKLGPQRQSAQRDSTPVGRKLALRCEPIPNGDSLRRNPAAAEISRITRAWSRVPPDLGFLSRRYHPRFGAGFTISRLPSPVEGGLGRPRGGRDHMAQHSYRHR